MGNCLVTKLKGVVDNDNLPILGKLAFNAKRGTGNNVYGLNRIGFNEDATIEVLHGSIGGQRSITIFANTFPYLIELGEFVTDEGYDYLTIVVPKYNIKYLTFLQSLDVNFGVNVNMNDFEYSILSGLYIIYNGDRQNKIKVIMNKSVSEKLTELEMASSEIQGEPFDVTDLGLNGRLSRLGLGGVTNLIGSMNNLGFSPISYLGGPNTKNVSFNIEQFVANNRTAGRTTGSLSLPYIGACNCTFNGAAVDNQESNSLSWTATTITFNGVTIDA
jgi:hypothetical protein